MKLSEFPLIIKRNFALSNMNERKKILYLITKSEWGGAGKYVYDLALAAKKRGFDVAVAAGGRGELAPKLKKEDIRYFNVEGLQRNVTFIKPFVSGLILLKIFFKFRPDVLHANSPQAAGIAGIALLICRLFAWKRSFQAVYTVHGWSYHEARPKWQNFLIRLFSKITCLFYQKIICVSEYDRQSALKFKIAPAKKLLTIHNGIDPQNLNFLSREEALQKLLGSNPRELRGFDPRKPVIGSVGEFTKNKGQKYLIEALGILKKSGEGFRGLIVGWGEEEQNLESRIKDLELKNEVRLITGLSPAAPYLKAFDIFVLPSLKEGLPYTLLEAGLAELPIVAANVGGIPEIIENEKSGLLVPPKNAGALAQAIERLQSDKKLRDALAKNLYKKVSAEFSKKEMLEKTFALYNQISSGRNDAQTQGG